MAPIFAQTVRPSAFQFELGLRSRVQKSTKVGYQKTFSKNSFNYFSNHFPCYHGFNGMCGVEDHVLSNLENNLLPKWSFTPELV